MSNKVPPHSIEAEKAVLGACLIEKEAFGIASELLTQDMFYNDRHGKIFGAMQEIAAGDKMIDTITVSGKFKDRENIAYINSLTNHVVSSAHIISHSRHIVEAYLRRQLITLGGNLYTKAFELNADPFELIEGAEKLLHSLTQNLNSKDVTRIDDTLIHIVRELEEKRHRKTYLTGIPTGFKDLDVSTCGWQPTDLIVLAARPKCGKTAFALNLGVNAALTGQGVGFFSMEMSDTQLVKRILSNTASVYLQSIRDARLDDGQMVHLFENGVKKLSGIPFFIDDTAALTVAEFKTKARRLVKKHQVKFLVVDYLQLMKPEKGKKNQNREQEVSANARELKIAAKELNVPILCLSQLSRAVETRGSHVPQLSDLRESGAIEQDADMVCFLYKPDPEQQQAINFKIAAFRNGELKEIAFDFQGQYQRFQEAGHLHLPSNFKPIREEDAFPTF